MRFILHASVNIHMLYAYIYITYTYNAYVINIHEHILFFFFLVLHYPIQISASVTALLRPSPYGASCLQLTIPDFLMSFSTSFINTYFIMHFMCSMPQDIYCILVIRHPDDCHLSDRKLFVKNNDI